VESFGVLCSRNFAADAFQRGPFRTRFSLKIKGLPSLSEGIADWQAPNSAFFRLLSGSNPQFFPQTTRLRLKSSFSFGDKCPLRPDWYQKTNAPQDSGAFFNAADWYPRQP
jgi:hypothetical protein